MAELHFHKRKFINLQKAQDIYRLFFSLFLILLLAASCKLTVSVGPKRLTYRYCLVKIFYEEVFH